MPKKTAAPAAAGGDATATKAAAPTKDKAPVEDKKPKEQPKQAEKAAGKGGEKPQVNNGKGKGQEAPPSPPQTTTTTTTSNRQPDRQFEPDDEVEIAIKGRISKLEAELKDHKTDIESVRGSIETKKDSQVQHKEDQVGLKKQSSDVGSEKGYSDRYTETLNALKAVQHQRKQKQTDLKTMKQQLGPHADQKDIFIKNLENDIRVLQERQASGDVGNLLEEKKLVQEIGKLTNNKKLFKSYTELNAVVDQYDTQVNNYRADLNKIEEERKEFRSKKKVFEDQITASRAKHNSTSEEIAEDINRRKELTKTIDEKKERLDGLYDQLREYRKDKRQKARDVRDAEQQKRADEKKAIEQKRMKEEEAKGFYTDEIEACVQLLEYLEPFKYRAPEAEAEKEKEEEGEKEKEEEGEKEEKEVESSPAPSKRGGKKKPVGETDKEKELKHIAQVFYQFETVSLVAPAKVGDVEDVITKINEKKDYLEKKAEEKTAKKKANGTS